MFDDHPRLADLVARAQQRSRHAGASLGLVYPCDALAIEAANAIRQAGIARPLLIGPRELILRAAGAAQIDVGDLEIIATDQDAAAAARRAAALARDGTLTMLMK